MDKSAWLGLGLGVLFGGTYAWLHLASMKRTWARQQLGQPAPMGGQAAGAMARMAVMLAAVFLVLQYTDANKWWFGGSLAMAYGVPFVWGLKVVVARKK